MPQGSRLRVGRIYRERAWDRCPRHGFATTVEDYTMSHTFGSHYTERRRASLAVRPAGQPFQLEPRTTMTEPISITALSLGMLPAFMRSALSATGGGVAHSASLSENSVGRANPASSSGDTWSHAQSVGLQGRPIAAAAISGQASSGAGASSDPMTSPGATGLRNVTPDPDVIGSLVPARQRATRPPRSPCPGILWAGPGAVVRCRRAAAHRPFPAR